MTRRLRVECAALIMLGAAPVFGQTTLFAPRVDIGNIPGASCTAILDANGDGKADIAVAAGGSIYLLLQNTNAPGTFANQGAVLSFGPNTTVTAIAAGDFNGDNKMDLAATVIGTGGATSFLMASLSNGNGTFQSPNIVATGNYTTIAVGDFNNDHKLDIVASTGVVGSIFLGDGAIGFSAAATLRFAGPLVGTWVTDFNRDGKPDAFIGSHIYLGNGNGTAGILQSGILYNPNTALDFQSSFTVTGDFNNDGKPDAISINLSGTGVSNLGNGDGTFQADADMTLPINNGNTNGLGAGDFNSDGKLDLVRLDAGSPSTVNIFSGTGSGLFQTTPISLTACTTNASAASNAVTVGDLNGDGIADVIASCGSGSTVSVFLSLAPSVFLQTSVNPSTPGQAVKLTAVAGSPSMGFLFANGFSVQFYDGGTPLSSPVTASNGQATLTTSSLAQGVHYLTAALLNSQNQPVTVSGLVSQVVAPASCAATVTGQLTITPGGFRRNPTNGQYTQTVSVMNASGTPISGPLSLALSSLAPGVTALNTDGFTTCSVQPTAAVVDMGLCPGGSLAPGASLSATLTFSNPSNKSITYSPVALAGLAPR